MIFITGGSGLVGSHLLYKLAKEGHQIRALVRDKKRIKPILNVFSFYSDSPQKLLDEIDFVEGDILDQLQMDEFIQGCEEVYHCAAVVSFHGSDLENMIKTNIEGTANIVNSCLLNNVKKLCYTSSTAAIGKDPNVLVNNEETTWTSNGASNYSITKYLAEMEVWRGVEEGLNAVIVNPSIILGPGEWGKSSTNLFKAINNGLTFYPTGANAFVDVRDVVDCMVKLQRSDIKNERFLVFSENQSFKKVFLAIADALKTKPPKIKATPILMKIGWRFAAFFSLFSNKKPGLTRESAASGNSTQVFSKDKLTAAISHEFISLEQSINDTAIIFRKFTF